MKTPATRTGKTTSIPPDILREIESFEDEAAKVLRGELSQDLFRPFRLQHGIYGQRQPGVQMVRIKIPFGGLNSTQLRVIAQMAERHAIGFRVTAGGGLGSTPRIAHLLYEYLPMEDLLPLCEAILKVFDNLGNRKNRHKARMKFVIDKLGFEEFKRRVEAEFAVTRKSHEGRSLTLPTGLDIPPQLIQLTPLTHPSPGLPVAPQMQRAMGEGKGEGGNGNDGRAETPFDMWRRTNVVPQRQPGFSAVFIRLAM